MSENITFGKETKLGDLLKCEEEAKLVFIWGRHCSACEPYKALLEEAKKKGYIKARLVEVEIPMDTEAIQQALKEGIKNIPEIYISCRNGKKCIVKKVELSWNLEKDVEKLKEEFEKYGII